MLLPFQSAKNGHKKINQLSNQYSHLVFNIIFV
jgi:hypothetical protein